MSGRKGMMHYKMEIKQEAVRLVEEERMTYAAVADRLNIRKAARIKAWVWMHRREGELSFHKPIGRPMQTESEEREVERWRTSLDTSKRNICGTSSKPPLRMQSNLLMNTFTFTTMNGYN